MRSLAAQTSHNSLICVAIFLFFATVAVVEGLRLANSPRPTAFINSLRNSHSQQRVVCSTPPSYGVVLTEAWKAVFLSEYYDSYGPVFDDSGHLFVGARNAVYKFDPTTGAQTGLFYLPSENVIDTLSVFDDRIVFGTSVMTGSNFYSVSTDLINQLWSTNLGANIQGSALTDGNLIFVSTNYNQLYALNPQSGAVVWSFNFTYSSQLVLLGPQFDGLGVSTLLFISNYYSPLQLTRLFANNGTVMWTISPPGNDPNSFATTYLPYVLGTSVYLGVYTNNSYWIWVVDIPTSQSSLRIPAYSDPLTPISPNDPLMVVNNEILYRNEGRPVKRGLISNGNGIVTTNNITFGNFPSGPFVFSDPDNVLLYTTQQGIEGYQYPNWTQKVWYDFEIPWPYIPDGVVLGNNCTSYIILGDTPTAGLSTVYALRELPLQPIVPIVECVKDEGNNIFTIYFGYQSQQTKPVRIPFGATKRNEFINASQSFWMTSTFFPGRSPLYPLSNMTMTVNLTMDSPIVSWILEGNIVTIDVRDPTLRCSRNLTFLLEFTTTEYFNETHAQILGDVIAQFMNISRNRVIVRILSVTPLQKRDLTFQEQGQQGFNVQVEVTILEGDQNQQQTEPSPDQAITDFLNQLQENHTVFETTYQNTSGSPSNGISFVLATPQPTGTERTGVPLNPPVSPPTTPQSLPPQSTPVSPTPVCPGVPMSPPTTPVRPSVTPTTPTATSVASHLSAIFSLLSLIVLLFFY